MMTAKLLAQSYHSASKGALFYIIAIFTCIFWVLVFLLLLNIGNIFTLKWDWIDRRYIYIAIEIVVDFIALFIMNLGVMKWGQSKNKLTYLTMWLLIIWSISLVLALIKKIFFFVLNPPITFEGTYWALLLTDLRLVWCFQAIATYLVYRIKVFIKENHRQWWDIFVLSLTVVTIIAQFLPLTSTIEDTVIGSLILIQALFIDVPIVVTSFKFTRRTRDKIKIEMTVEDRQMHYGFLFLFLLALSFLLIYLSFILSNVYQIATGMTYNFFYAFQLAFTALAIAIVYLGFIMPKWFKRIIFPNSIDTKERDYSSK